MYSLGVIAYTMIIGYLPFKIESDGLYEKKIVWQLFDRQESYELHPEIICFLKKLLESDPNKRITPRAALESTFFK